ncbi:spore germination protein [Paenibacillus sp. OV219]|uniref:spore germination protein n=1 Tax=Paenibacillus sp. OV219 TaxID=1884377 RepID=UPI0008CA6787|nr:spore germination protein [Paenibacillus sp. OV219]SEO00756.1 spore germination protein KA [Paenibacillus sp. OV219]
MPKVYQEKANDTTSHVLTAALEENEAVLKNMFQSCSDVVFRSFQISGQKDALLVYIDGLIEEKQLDESLLKPLMLSSSSEPLEARKDILTFLQNQFITISQVKRASDISIIVQNVLKGYVAIIIEAEAEALMLSIQGGKTRSIEQTSSETTIRGPRDSFTESIRTNTSLIRRRIRTTRLKFESLTVGELTQTDVEIAYLEDIANPAVIQEIRSRIERIQIDGVLESGYIEQFIEERSFSPFPQYLVTERPDYVVAALLEGRVAVFTDGTPFVLSGPMSFWGFLQAGEDYYDRVLFANLIRIIRLALMMIALFLPSIYVALTTFHQQMIPTNLLLSISAAREGVPFPAIVEALIMESTFEALREAGVRLPKQIGQAVSIVGGLVVGQAAVQAGIVSTPMVIVVSLTGIASFAIPRYNFSFAFRILRFPMILLAGMFGLYGITVGMLCILIHLASLKSLGVPYLFPISPVSFQGLKDTIFRAPLWTMNYRPQLDGKSQAQTRIPKGQEP